MKVGIGRPVYLQRNVVEKGEESSKVEMNCIGRGKKGSGDGIMQESFRKGG